MIKTIKNDRANWLIKVFVGNEKLMKLDPVIAGGSALAVYRALKMHDTEAKWNELKRKIEKPTGYGKKNFHIEKFSDIDIWFLKDNDVHDKDNQNNWLVRTIDSAVESAGWGISHAQLPPISEGNVFNLRPNKTSKWANTYVNSPGGYPRSGPTQLFTPTIQFVKTPIDSVNSLLESFDFINCSVAWHNNILYYDNRIDDAFDNFELRLNSDAAYLKDSIATKMFNALRAYKYTQRYNLSFSKKLSNHIFNVYSESKDIDYSEYKDKLLELETLYGKKISSVETVKSMVESLYRLFAVFIEMETFRPEYALYLVDLSDKIPKLKEYINKETGLTPKAASDLIAF